MKQFEHAIQKIAAEVSSIDRTATVKEISALEESIDGLHAKLATVDRRVSTWATKNLDKVTLGVEMIEPQDAAAEITTNAGQFEWIEDALGIDPAFAPQFSDEDIVRLRSARQALGEDIGYLDASLPQMVEFPDSKALLEVHRDLAQFEKLKQDVENGHVPSLANSSQKTLTKASELLSRIEGVLAERGELIQRDWPPAAALKERLKRGKKDELLALLEALGAELHAANDQRTIYLERPINARDGFDLDPEVMAALRNLAQGKKPFGFLGFMGKAAQKQEIVDSIRLLGQRPIGLEAWTYVVAFASWRERLRALEVWPGTGPSGAEMQR